MNIRRLIEIQCYRGLRHRRNLPVHGQRTHTNARTRKGPRKGAVAAKKKSPPASSRSQLRFADEIRKCRAAEHEARVLTWQKNRSSRRGYQRSGKNVEAQERVQEEAGEARRPARRGAHSGHVQQHDHHHLAVPDGRTVIWSSAGSIGFKGSRKGTPYAAQQASMTAAGVARDQYGMKSVEVRVKGPGSGRESAVRALASSGLHINAHQGRHADSAQRLPSAEAPPCLIN